MTVRKLLESIGGFLHVQACEQNTIHILKQNRQSDNHACTYTVNRNIKHQGLFFKLAARMGAYF